MDIKKIYSKAAVSVVGGVLSLASRCHASGIIDPFPIPTLGGIQYWSDEFFFHEWRIQRNVVTGHFRLLDGSKRRHAWGTYTHCRKELERIRRVRGLEPMKGKAVIVLHGLFANHKVMRRICSHFEDHGFKTFDVTYPSTQRNIADHAMSLHKVISTLEGIDEIHVVAHSMGNIVFRHYIGDRTDPARGLMPDSRIKRVVMIAAPNHGSKIARAASDKVPFPFTELNQLGKGWKTLEPNLGTPSCPFGVIAGGRGDGKGYNPLLPGDDDGVVTVESVKLVGAADFRLVPAMHSALPSRDEVREMVVSFLENGYFVTEETRTPIQ